VDLTPPPRGQSNTYKSGWNGGWQGWLMKGSLLGSSRSLREAQHFRVDLFVGSAKIASGEFSEP